MSKKILTTLLAVILLVAIVVPTMASPYYADGNTNSGVLPEDASSSSSIEGDAVPYGAPVPYGGEKYFTAAQIAENASTAWANIADKTVESGDINAASASGFSFSLVPVSTGDDYYSKNLRVRIYLTATPGNIIDWAKTTATSINYSNAGEPKIAVATKNISAGYIEYSFGDLFNDGYVFSGDVTPVFLNNATATGSTINAEIQLWHEDASSADERIVLSYNAPADNKETKKYIATSEIKWAAIVAVLPTGTSAAAPKKLDYEVQTDTTGYKFTFTATDNITTSTGDLAADYIDFSGEVVLSAGVSMADISKASLTFNGQPLSNYGTAVSNIDFKLQGNKVIYSFRYDHANGVPPTINTPTSVVELSLNEILIAGFEKKAFTLNYTGSATATGVDGTSNSLTGNKTSTIYVERPGLPPTMDKDLYDSMEVGKNVVVTDAGGTPIGGYYPDSASVPDVENSGKIYYDITKVTWDNSYSVKNLIIWDTFGVASGATQYLVADTVRVGNYRTGSLSAGAKSVSIVVGGVTYTWVFGIEKTGNEVVNVADILANAKIGGTGASVPAGKTAKDITAMGLGFGDVAGDFAVVDNASCIRFGFVVNPDELPVKVAAAERVLTNNAKLGFEYTVSPHSAQQYDKTVPNTQAHVAANDIGTLVLKKTVSKTTNVTYGDVLTYTATISNTAEANKKIPVGILTDKITSGASALTFGSVSSIILKKGSTNVTNPFIIGGVNAVTKLTSNDGAGSLTWDFRTAGVKYQLMGGHSIVITYTYIVKTAAELGGAPLPSNIANIIKLDTYTGTGIATGTVVDSGPRPIIFYSIDAAHGGAAVKEFDPTANPQLKVDYTMTIQNKQNKKEGSVNLSKLTFDIDMPNGFAPVGTGTLPDATTLTISRSGRALSLAATVLLSNATSVVVEYKVGAVLFCTVTYTKTIVGTVDKWKFTIAFVENTATTILNARAAGDTTSPATDDEMFTVKWSALPANNIAAFQTSVAYAFFNTTATLKEVKGLKRSTDIASTTFTPQLNAASQITTEYIVENVATHITNNNTTKTITAATANNTRVLTVPMGGKCGTRNNVTMTTSVTRPSTTAYAAKYNQGSAAAKAGIYTGQNAEVIVIINNEAGRTFNPQDNTMFVQLPIGLTATAGGTITVTRSNNYIAGATDYYGNSQTLNTSVAANVASVTQLNTAPGVTADQSASLVELTFPAGQELNLTSFFGQPNVVINGGVVKWTKVATATIKLAVKVEETYVTAGSMTNATGTDGKVTGILPFTTGTDLANNTHISGGKAVSDGSFTAPASLGIPITYDRAYTSQGSRAGFRMMHVVNMESKFTTTEPNLTHKSDVSWEFTLKHSSTNVNISAGSYVIFTVPKYIEVSSILVSNTFTAANTPSATQIKEYVAGDTVTTADYTFDYGSVPYNPEYETLYVYRNTNYWAAAVPKFTINAKVVIENLEDIKYYGDRTLNAYFIPAILDQDQIVTSAKTTPSAAAVTLDTTKCAFVADTLTDAPHIFKGLPATFKTAYAVNPLKSIKTSAVGSVLGGIGASVYTALEVDGRTALSNKPQSANRKVLGVELGEEILYSFAIQNSSMAPSTNTKAFVYKDLVLINRLPGVGDLGSVNPSASWPRNSAFKPEFYLGADLKPQITVWEYDLSSPNYVNDPESCKTPYAGLWSALYTDDVAAVDGVFGNTSGGKDISNTNNWEYGTGGSMGWANTLADYNTATAIKINIPEVKSQRKIVVEVKMRVPEVIDFTDYVNARLAANPTDYVTDTNDFIASNSFGISMSLDGGQIASISREQVTGTNHVSLGVKDPENAWTSIDNIVENCLDEKITKEFAQNNSFTLTLKDKWRPLSPVQNIVFTYDAATQKYVTLTPGSWALGQYEIVEAKFNGYNASTLNGLFDVIVKHEGDDVDDDLQGVPTLAGATTTINSYVMRKNTTGIPVDELTFVHIQKEATLRIDTILAPPAISIGGFTPGETDNQDYVLKYPDAPGRAGSGGTFANPQTEDMQNSIVDFKKLTWGTDEEFSLTFNLPYGWKPDRLYHSDYVKIAEDDVANYSRFMIKFKLTTPSILSGGTVNLAHAFSIHSVMQSGAISLLKSWNGYAGPGSNSISEFHVIADGYGIGYGEKFKYIPGDTGAQMVMQTPPAGHVPSYLLGQLKKGYYELYEVSYGYDAVRLNEDRWVYWTTVERTLNGKTIEASVYKYVGNDGNEDRIYVEDEQTWITGVYNYRYEEPEKPVTPPKSYYYGSSSDESSVSSLPQEFSSSSEAPVIPIVAPPVNGKSWSLVNLIMSIVAATISLLLFFAFFKRKEQEEGEYDEQGEKAGNAPLVVFMRILAIVLGVSVGILFLILEDLRTPMTIINQWTILLGIIFTVHLLVTIIYAIVKKREDKAHEIPYAETETDTDTLYVG